MQLWSSVYENNGITCFYRHLALLPVAVDIIEIVRGLYIQRSIVRGNSLLFPVKVKISVNYGTRCVAERVL